MGYEAYPETYYATAGETAAAMIVGVLVTLIIVLYATALVFAVAQYVMNAISIMRMAKKLSIPNGWLGFIPFADVYMLGKIADVSSEKKINAKRLLITEIVYFAIFIVYMVLAFAIGLISAVDESAAVATVIVFLMVLLLFLASTVCLAVFEYIAFYRIAQNFGGKNATGYFLGILLGGLFVSTLVSTVLLLVLSFKEPAKTSAAPDVIEAAAADSVF